MNTPTTRFSLRRLFLVVFGLSVFFGGLSFLLQMRRRAIRSRIITERSQWPAELESLVAPSELTAEDIDSIEVYSHGIDGWVCRMTATPQTVALLSREWVPIAQCRAPQQAALWFWKFMPDIWQSDARTRQVTLFAHKDFNMAEDGNGTAYVGMYDQDRQLVYIWYYFNF